MASQLIKLYALHVFEGKKKLSDVPVKVMKEVELALAELQEKND